jgi:hypothetical protein
VHVTIKEANLAPLVRAVNHTESNDNEGFFEEIKITQEYCAYPIPEKYQLSLVLHQVLTLFLYPFLPTLTTLFILYLFCVFLLFPII